MQTHLEPLWRELMGAELRAERHRQRRTLAEVAAAAGVSMQHLSDVERGRKDPSSELLAAILGALGVDLRLLLLRLADGAVASAPPTRHGGAVLALSSSPAGPRASFGPGSAHGASAPWQDGSRPADSSGVTLLAAA